MSTATTDRYTIISADCHAGGSHQQYREFLEAEWVDEFDAWRGEYSNPFRDLQDDGRARNWDDERRIADLETGRPGRRGHVPEHGAAVLPDRRGDRPGAPGRGGLPPPVGRAARPQPLARRLVRPLPRPARRHRPDLPRRRRRRDRRGRVDGRPRPARRRAHPRHPRRRAHAAVLLGPLRPPVGGVRGARRRRRPPHHRHRPARLRQVPELHDPVDDRDRLVRAPAAVAAADERRVRALPEPQARAHRAGLRLDPAAAHAARRVPHADAVGSHRRDEPQERPGAAADADASTSSATCGSA